MYVYVCIYMNVCIWMYVYVCMYMHVCICKYVYVCMYMYVCICMYVYVCMYMYVCICMYVYKYGLQEAQKKLKIKQRPLLQDVATRWGSTRASRASFLDHKDDNNDEVKVGVAKKCRHKLPGDRHKLPGDSHKLTGDRWRA